MMKRNVAAQRIGVQMVSAGDGAAFTGAVTVYITGDAGTQAIGSVGSGVCAHEGNGYHTYTPSQAETNYDLIAFTFIGSGAVPVTLQVFTNWPQSGDAFAHAAAIKAKTDSLTFSVPNKVDANVKAVNDLPAGSSQVNVHVVNKTTFQNGKLTIVRSADYASQNSNLIHLTDVANIDGADELYLTIVNLQTQTALFTRKPATAFDEILETADFAATGAELTTSAGTQYAFAVERKKSDGGTDYYNPILLGPCEIRDNNRTF